MSILPVGFTPITPIVMPTAVDLTAPAASTGAGSDFAAMLTKGIDSVQQAQSSADSMAVQAATGDLQDVHDYTIAATQAQLATELTVAVRNKAVEAFSDIMRMQL
jgi:flagellar hook-basal body complex protein FliE